MPDEVSRDDKPAKPRLRLEDRRQLYAARGFIDRGVEEALGLRIPFDVYFKDPLVGQKVPELDLDTEFPVPWEPGLGDGPTSARFAVVDFDGTTNVLTRPARWDRKNNVFLGPASEVLRAAARETPQFRQVSTWAVLQNTLDHMEGGFGLGRRILWAFEGNRLIVCPHAGYGENAYYDRRSKSLQFYYFKNDDGDTIYTCQSSDIVNHEFGHALLDGIRPYYLEAVSPETAGFHEFMGDLIAIIMAFRNNAFRGVVGGRSHGDLAGEALVSDIAQQFGEAVTGQDYLRSADNDLTMKDVRGDLRPHRVSQVMTGAMFEILLWLSVHYRDRERVDGRAVSVGEAFWYSIDRFQMMAFQALDLLPPIEVTFGDYARAILRAEQIANPTDPHGYRKMMIDIFIGRGILTVEEGARLLEPDYVFDRLDLAIFHDAGAFAGSRADAYRFLDDNRVALLIPANADLILSDVFTAQKFARLARRLPKQIVLQYVWREEVVLEGPDFGSYAGQATGMLCGATLVLDENGALVAWERKPGTGFIASGARATAEQEAGAARRKAWLATLSRRIQAGMVGEALGSAGLFGEAMPQLVSRPVDGALRFELTPHLFVDDHAQDHSASGGRPWQISS